MPRPVSARARASGAYGGLGLRVREVSSSPVLNSRQPAEIDQRGLTALVQRPASKDAAIIKAVIGRNTRAIW